MGEIHMCDPTVAQVMVEQKHAITILSAINLCTQSTLQMEKLHSLYL